MKVIDMELSLIKDYENNPRINDEAAEYVAESIKKFGFKVPIIIDANNTIIAGHTRKKAAVKLGMNKVPVIVANDLDDDQVKAFRLADNKVAEFSEWDDEMLLNELDNIAMEMQDFGFGDELTSVIDEEVEEDDFETEIPTEPLSKRGEIYQLGRHRLMCGSSIDENDVKKLVDNHTINLVYTDPPYGMNAVSKSGVLSERYNTDILGDDDNSVAIEAFILCNKLFNNSRQIWWGANYYTECLPSSECWIVWDKNNGKSDQTDAELAWANFRSVVRMFTMASEKINRVHPTQKPVKLFEEIIYKFEKEDKFERILDLFGGSGSTLIAAEQMGRTAYVMELDPKFCDVIIKRWEDYTGKKAVKLNA